VVFRNREEKMKIKRALISVWDKTGIVEFAKGLDEMGVEILSTGGTARLLRQAGLRVVDVSQYTDFPEMLEGRVKTLHPKIHAGLLAKRENPGHMEQLKKQNISLIDMVVVNLYPFEKTVEKGDASLDEAIENIDIGGPSMLRSAAKNFNSVAVICDPSKYGEVLKELKENDCSLSSQTAAELAVDVFNRTWQYDLNICQYLKKAVLHLLEGFDEDMALIYKKVRRLRYGENPHQKACLYKETNDFGLGRARQLHGKELSFNNILDLNAALEIVQDFPGPACAVIKHLTPCGAASCAKIVDSFRQAYRCDPLSAFGGIVGLNRKVDFLTAQEISRSGFLECIIAPAYDKKALDILMKKKNLRILEIADIYERDPWDLKKVTGGLLLQDKDLQDITPKDLRVVTKKTPTQRQLETLLFAWKVAKFVKSNAIVLAKSQGGVRSGARTVGIGAGQTSRVDSVMLAIRKAGQAAKGSVLASDAFFPKEDAVLTAVKAGIRAIIQPGGSIRDEEVIRLADRFKIAMVFTGMRHFRH
jgi:phosphoribosylaminoimidazolecarboxamide formyltransferase/IMP cyclohydrolase